MSRPKSDTVQVTVRMRREWVDRLRALGDGRSVPEVVRQILAEGIYRAEMDARQAYAGERRAEGQRL